MATSIKLTKSQTLFLVVATQVSAIVANKEGAQLSVESIDAITRASRQHADSLISFLSEHFQRNELSDKADRKAIVALLTAHKADVKGLSHSFLASNATTIRGYLKAQRTELRIALTGNNYSVAKDASPRIAAIDKASRS